MQNRFLVGLHDGLHPSRKALLDCVNAHKDQITEISAFFNYPKDTHCPGSWRIYHKVFGGTMLDLGIYPFKLVKEIGSIIGFDIMNFDRENKRIKIKREKETKVDMEM